MTNRQRECAAIEKANGMYRLIEVSWDSGAAENSFDYYHAAFELDGRWNAEFFDDSGRSIWVHGIEDSLDFDWEIYPIASSKAVNKVESNASVQVSVTDVEFNRLPVGSLCQTVEERSKGIPRHWKKWRIV